MYTWEVLHSPRVMVLHKQERPIQVMQEGMEEVGYIRSSDETYESRWSEGMY